MHGTRFPSAAVIIIACLWSFAGCARSQRARFYVLSSIAQAPVGERQSAANNDITICLGPVEIPPYLDRPQIVTHSGAYRLELAEYERWAEPLKQSVPRVLAENLSVILGKDRVTVCPWKGSKSFDYEIVVTLTRLDATLDGKASLGARWSIIDKDGQRVLATRNSDIHEQAVSQGYEAIAEAHSRALARLSEEMAAEIDTLSQAKITP